MIQQSTASLASGALQAVFPTLARRAFAELADATRDNWK